MNSGKFGWPQLSLVIILLAIAVVMYFLLSGAADELPTNDPGSPTEPSVEATSHATNPAAEEESVEKENLLRLTGERPLAALEPAARNGYYSAYPEMVIDVSKDYEAVFVTEKGEMRFRLFTQQAPLTVNNLVFLATQGFYDGVSFHRVMQNFMAQGGDPSGIGSGGPGYNFKDETNPELRFDRAGLLAMANAGAGTNGSQFFMTFVPTPHLNGAHTIYGELISGAEVLTALSLRNPGALPAGAPPGDLITTVEIYESTE